MGILDSFFGRQLGPDWPVEYVIGRGAPELPAELTRGDASNIEALSAAYHGPLSAIGPKGRNKSQFRVQARALDLYKNGLTVYFENIGDAIPEVGTWLRALEAEIGIPAGGVRASIFASPGEQRGLMFHYDANDVVIAPLRGTKRIDLANNPAMRHAPAQYNPGYRLLADDLAAARDHAPQSGPVDPARFDLEPGMAVFVPAGCWHATEHPDESFSLSLSFEWPRRVDLALARLRRELLRDEAWRAPAYGAWSADARVRRSAEDGIARALPALRASAAALAPRRILAEVAASDAASLYLDEDTAYCPAPFFELALAADADCAAVSEVQVRSSRSFTAAVIEVEQRFVRPCRWVGSRRDAFTLGELMRASDVSLDVAREVATSLAEAGYLCRLAFTPRSSAPPETASGF